MSQIFYFICFAGFFQQCNLKRHMASHSVENGAQGFKCEHCSATFTTKSVLSVHLREAHGDKLVTKKEAQKAANASDRNNTSGVDNLQQMIMKGPKVSRGFPQRFLFLVICMFVFSSRKTFHVIYDMFLYYLRSQDFGWQR